MSVRPSAVPAAMARHAASQRSAVLFENTAAVSVARAANARSPRSGNTKDSGSCSTASASGSPRSSRQARIWQRRLARPNPQVRARRRLRVSRPHRSTRADAWPFPTSGVTATLVPRRPVSGMRVQEVRPRNDEARHRCPHCAATLLQHLGSTSATTGMSNPPSTPSAHSRAPRSQSRWQKRLASGGDISHPSAACSGGFAAATTVTPAGRSRSPTVRSSTTRRSAAWTAGGAVEISSRKRMPRPHRTAAAPSLGVRTARIDRTRSRRAARRSRTAHGYWQ